MKKVLAIVLIAALVLLLTGCETTGYRESDWELRTLEDGTKEVAKFLNTEATETVFPEGVIGIGEGAFEDCAALTSITIPEGVTSIGKGAFTGCAALTSITIPEGVINIGEGAFEDCAALTSITIPEGVTSIGKGAFTGCAALTSITIPEGVTSIGEGTFKDCAALTSITIPEGVASIQDEAFSGCTSLSEIVLPASIRYLGDYLFRGCSSLTSLTLTVPDNNDAVRSYISQIDMFDNTLDGCALQWLFGKRTDGKLGVLAYNDDQATSIVIPDGITYIADGVFGRFDASITIPSSVTSIGAYALGGATLIVVPGSHIEQYAIYNGFPYTYNTDDVVQTYTSGDWEIREYGEGVKEIVKLTNTETTTAVIPEGITSIGVKAFSECSSLTSITIPESVTSIGMGAFQYCSSLTNITLPNSVTSIGECAFKDCASLTSITLPNGVTCIGVRAFEYCNSLANVIVTPGSYAEQFADDTYMPYTYVEGSTFTEGDWELYSLEDGRKKIVSFLNTTATEAMVPEGVTSIGSGAFAGNTSLSSITIPDSVTSIGRFAFYGCTSLISIAIPDSVTSIGASVFAGCSSLNSVTIPDSVTSIGVNAFAGCSSLNSVTIPDSVTSIGESAFKDCTSLTSLTIPDSVFSIGEGAFESCRSLTFCFVPDGSYAQQYAENNGLPLKSPITDERLLLKGDWLAIDGSAGSRYGKIIVHFYGNGTGAIELQTGSNDPLFINLSLFNWDSTNVCARIVNAMGNDLQAMNINLSLYSMSDDSKTLKVQLENDFLTLSDSDNDCVRCVASENVAKLGTLYPASEQLLGDWQSVPSSENEPVMNMTFAQDRSRAIIMAALGDSVDHFRLVTFWEQNGKLFIMEEATGATSTMTYQLSEDGQSLDLTENGYTINLVRTTFEPSLEERMQAIQ